MAVHGRYEALPVCGTRVQRIRYAENETNYCPRCQTGGRMLGPFARRLLKDDWPKTSRSWSGANQCEVIALQGRVALLPRQLFYQHVPVREPMHERLTRTRSFRPCENSRCP